MRISDSFYQINRQNILNALKKNGVKSVEVQYSGSGDSGQIDDVSDVPDDQIEMHDSSSRFSEGEWRESVTLEKRPLREAVEWLCYEVLEREHPGWEINEGSNGTLQFDVKEAKIHLTHNYFTIETEENEV